MVNCFIQIWSYNLRFIALQWMEQNIIKGWTCIIKVILCVCVRCFLQEVSLHLWHCMTMSHGQRLTWPLGKATSFRLSTTRKNQQSSASSSLSNATTSQKYMWTDLYTHVTAYKCVREWTQSELVTVERVWSSPSVDSNGAEWHFTNAFCSCRCHHL